MVSKFKLPINIIQLAVSGVTKPNLLPCPRQPPRLLNFPEMPTTVKGLRQLWKERALGCLEINLLLGSFYVTPPN